jgi:hypothetical protein
MILLSTMGRENVAVLGCTLKSTESSKNGTYVIQTLPDLKWAIKNKGVYRGPITVIVSGATDGTVQGGSGTGVINPSGNDDWNMENKGKPIRENDESEEITISGTIPPSTPGTFTMKVKVEKSGQTDSKKWSVE